MSRVLSDHQLKSAHEALGNEEILLQVFCELDCPGGFAAVNKRFRTVAKSKGSIFSWFRRRYYRNEMLYELLRRQSVCTTELIEHFLDLSHGALFSRFHTYYLSLYKGVGDASRTSPMKVPLHSATLSCLWRKNVHLKKVYDKGQQRKTLDGMAYQDLEMLARLVSRSDAEGDRSAIETLITSCGMPAYNRRMTCDLLLCALRSGHDCDWLFDYARKYGGTAPLSDPQCAADVLRLLFETPSLHHVRSGPVWFFNLRTEGQDAALLPPHSAKLLCERLGYVLWKTGCQILTGGFRASSTWLHGAVTPRADLQAAYVSLLQATDIEEPLRHLVVHLLASFRGSWLLNPPERQRFIELWRSHLFLKPYPGGAQHCEPQISALVIWLYLQGYLTDLDKKKNKKTISGHITKESAILLLSNPWLYLNEFERALVLVAEKLCRDSDLHEVLQRVLDRLLKNSTAGCQLIELAANNSWVASGIVERVNTSNVKWIFVGPEVEEAYTTDPVELGVRSYRLASAASHPEWLDTAPKKGFLPLALAILSILKDQRDAKSVLSLILREAKARGQTRLVDAYKQAGVVVDVLRR